jgi:hypothetical protein
VWRVLYGAFISKLQLGENMVKYINRQDLILGRNWMKKSLIVGVLILVMAVVSENALAIEYNTTISPALTVEVGECFYMDIRLENVPTLLITAGFFMVHNPSLATIADVAAYDGELEPRLWDFGSFKAPDAAGPGTYYLACLNLGAGVAPDDVRIARAEICPIAAGINTITITTIPDFMTVVSGIPDYECYDPQISPHVVTVNQIPPPCRCTIIGPSMISADPLRPVTAQYGVSSNQHCANPSEYVWSDTCVHGDIDQNGLMTVPPFYYGESCEVCVTDTANTDINTGEVVSCCRPIQIAGG